MTSFKTPPSDTIFIGELPAGTTQETLQQLWKPQHLAHNAVKRFAFARFPTVDQARSCAEALQQQGLGGKRVHVDFAREREHTQAPRHVHLPQHLKEIHQITMEIRESDDLPKNTFSLETFIQKLKEEGKKPADQIQRQTVLFDFPSWNTATAESPSGIHDERWLAGLKEVLQLVRQKETLSAAFTFVFVSRLPTTTGRDPRALFLRDRTKWAMMVKPHTKKVSLHNMKDYSYLISTIQLANEEQQPSKWEKRYFEEEDTLSNLPPTQLPPYITMMFHVLYGPEFKEAGRLPTTYDYILRKAMELTEHINIHNHRESLPNTIARATGMLRHKEHPGFAFTMMVHADQLQKITDASCGKKGGIPYYFAIPVQLLDALGEDSNTHHSFFAKINPKFMPEEANRVSTHDKELWIYPAGFDRLEIFIRKEANIQDRATGTKLACFRHDGTQITFRPSPTPQQPSVTGKTAQYQPVPTLCVFPEDKGAPYPLREELEIMKAALTYILPGATVFSSSSQTSFMLKVTEEQKAVWEGWVGYLGTAQKVRILAKFCNPIQTKDAFRKLPLEKRNAILHTQYTALQHLDTMTKMRADSAQAHIDAQRRATTSSALSGAQHEVPASASSSSSSASPSPPSPTHASSLPPTGPNAPQHPTFPTGQQVQNLGEDVDMVRIEDRPTTPPPQPPHDVVMAPDEERTTTPPRHNTTAPPNVPTTPEKPDNAAKKHKTEKSKTKENLGQGTSGDQKTISFGRSGAPPGKNK